MKKVAALLCGAVLATSAVCSATVSTNKVEIGGITPGISVSKLISMYGQPISRHGDELRFNGFNVEIDEKNPNIIEEIEVYGGTFATPNGVRLGQSAEILNRTYGAADNIAEDWNESAYEYYTHDYSKTIEFKIQNGVITKIKCKLQD